jgi:hypothetical protein
MGVFRTVWSSGVWRTVVALSCALILNAVRWCSARLCHVYPMCTLFVLPPQTDALSPQTVARAATGT